jgi:ribosomal protein S27E
MIIPTGNSYTATVVGQELREVKCENCHGQYVYFVRVQATGSGFSPMFLNEGGAHARAGGEARMKVQRQLRGLHLPVPCPDCGWYQAHMVQILRYRRLRRWMWIVAAPLIWLALRWCVAPSDVPTNLHAGFCLAISAALAIVATIFHLTWLDNMNPTRHTAANTPVGGIAMRKADFEKLKAAQSNPT